MTVEVAGILLAAGYSRRFGSAKLLQPIPGTSKPMALFSAQNLFDAIPHSVVVTRTNDNTLVDILNRHHIPTIGNPLSQNGLSSSIQCGLSHFPEARAWVLALADMPFIDVSVIMAVSQALKDKAVLVAPVYNGIRGHPVGFAAEFKHELMQLKGDCGAKSIIESHISQLRHIEVSCHGVIQDIDVPEQLPSVF